MKNGFKIPLQSEIEKYIREKKGNWPSEFVKYYSERFFNFYQSNGWKVSGKAAMKDWKAAFNSQWQTLRFKEDIEAFTRMEKEAKRAPKIPTDIPQPELSDVEKLDALIDRYNRNPSSVDFESMSAWYEYMRDKKILKTFTKGEVSMIQNAYGNDKTKCRAAAVQKTLEGYINTGLRVKDIFKMRERLETGIAR